MIRAVLILLGVVLGLAVGVAAGARVGHLALIPGLAPPPAWVERLSPMSGLASGQADLGAARLSWRIAPLDGPWLRWNFVLDGSGTFLRATAVPDLAGMTFALDQGSVDLAQVMPRARALDLAGEVILRGGQADLPWRTRQLADLRLEGRVIELTWQDQPLGAFDLAVTQQRPTWRADLAAVPGNAIAARLALEGLSGGTSLAADLRVQDGPGLPAALRRALNRIGPLSDGAWRVQTRLRLPRPLP